MQITKGDLINGAYTILMISGITVNPSASDISIALDSADDLAGQLLNGGLDIGWQYPSAYGASTQNDTSGLSFATAGAFKKILAVELLPIFGKPASPELSKLYNDAMRTIEKYCVSVPEAQFPSTLPVGSGSEYGMYDNKFSYTPLVNNDAIYVYKDDILNVDHDFSSWLIDASLSTVTWTTENSNLTISSESATTTVASAQVTFNTVGSCIVYITATNDTTTDQITVTKNFIIRDRS